MKTGSLSALVVGLVFGAAAVYAQTPSVQLESRVTGNRELPKVTYILPWRQPAEMDFSWQPEAGIAADLFQPLRRDEYRRELHYQNTLTESATGARSSATDNSE
jgi:hypothetical protein